MTNKDWVRQLNTKQLAQFLACKDGQEDNVNDRVLAIESWLKEEHKMSEIEYIENIIDMFFANKRASER